jgi:hypothetical protein
MFATRTNLSLKYAHINEMFTRNHFRRMSRYLNDVVLRFTLNRMVTAGNAMVAVNGTVVMHAVAAMIIVMEVARAIRHVTKDAAVTDGKRSAGAGAGATMAMVAGMPKPAVEVKGTGLCRHVMIM